MARPRQLFFTPALLAAGIVLAACGGSEKSASSAATATAAPRAAATQASAQQPFAPVVAASELVVGENRFSLGIIEQSKGQPLPDAQVHFRFFTLQGNQGTLRAEADARFIAPARDAGIGGVIEHKHADGSAHPHANVEADVGVYVASALFEQAGDWGVEATFKTPDGREGRVTAPFKVAAKGSTPAVGAAAPRSKNPTAKDVKDLTQIDTAIDPVAGFHQESIADAVAAGKPALVGFMTPGYCQTRFCGPSYEVMKKLLPKYGDKAALIHVEIYKDPVTKTPTDTVNEWRITSEPYFFILDRNGMITAKFEGPTSLAELDEALKKVTG